MPPRFHPLLAALLLVHLTLALPSRAEVADVQETPGLRGRKLAEAKIANGQLEIITHGMSFTPKSQAAYEARYDALLAEHGIKFINRGCIAVTSLMDDAFNSRMQEEIALRYGETFWDDIQEQARAEAQAGSP